MSEVFASQNVAAQIKLGLRGFIFYLPPYFPA